MAIEITTPSRLHITLIDLNASIGRVDGGIGLTIQVAVQLGLNLCDTIA